MAQTSGGSLIVAGDADSAAEEHERCEERGRPSPATGPRTSSLDFDAAPSDEHVAKVDAAIRALAGRMTPVTRSRRSRTAARATEPSTTTTGTA